MLEIKLTANILQEGENCFTAWINEIRGVVAQGETLDEAKKELFKMLRIKLDIEREENITKNVEGLITEEYNLVQA